MSSCCAELSVKRSANASAGRGADEGGSRRKKGRGGRRSSEGAAAQQARRGGVVEQFAPVDVSHVERESDILKGCLFWFVPPARTGPDVRSKEELAALVKRLGGAVRAVPSLPHCMQAGKAKPSWKGLTTCATVHVLPMSLTDSMRCMGISCHA